MDRIDASKEIPFTAEPDDTFSVTLNVAPGDAVDCIWFDAWMTESDLGTRAASTNIVCPDGYNTASGGAE